MPKPAASNLNETIAAAIEPVVDAVVEIERKLLAPDGINAAAMNAAAIHVSAAESAILAAVHHFAYD